MQFGFKVDGGSDLPMARVRKTKQRTTPAYPTIGRIHIVLKICRQGGGGMGLASLIVIRHVIWFAGGRRKELT